MSDKMTFSDLLNKMTENTGASEKVIRELKKQMGLELRAGLKKDGVVHMKGLGTFYLKLSEDREGINPQTGETIDIPAHNHITFRPDASVRRVINKEYENLRIFILDENDKQEPIPSEEPQEAKAPGWMWVLLVVLILSLLASLLFKKEIIIIEEIPVVELVTVTNKTTLIEEVIIVEKPVILQEASASNKTTAAAVVVPVSDEAVAPPVLSDEEAIEEFVIEAGVEENPAPPAQTMSNISGGYVDPDIAAAEAGFAEGEADEAVADALTADAAAELADKEAASATGSDYEFAKKKADKADAAAHEADVKAEEAVGAAMVADETLDEVMAAEKMKK